MPHASLKLVPGTDTQETPALNENSGISQTNLIRFFYDRNGIALVQKLGGWSKFYQNSMPTFVRALWAWEDLNVTAHLAVATETIPATGSALLAVITNGSLQDVTPTFLADNVPLNVTTVGTSPVVTIQDTVATGITSFNSVYIATQISIGGLILFGMYQCDPDGYIDVDSYTIYARDQLGNLLPATSNSTTPLLPQFTTATGSVSVNVNFPNYTYQVGDTFPVLVPTTVGGITIYGNYVVQTIVDANNFTIVSNLAATSVGSAFLNNGNARFVYSFGQGVAPTGTGYGLGGYGLGGYGTGSPLKPALGTKIDAVDWTLDNWGEVLISCPIRNLKTVGPLNMTPYQPIYQWDPSSAAATIITNAPPVNDGIFVAMPQRQIVAWGSTATGIQDPLLVTWCDVGNYNSWIPTVINQAGSYRIPKGSKIVGCVQGPQQALIWTDIDVWSMQYIGPPYVYSFNEIGTGCGLIARKAAAFSNGIGYWMGPLGFFNISSNGVQPLQCSVWDQVYQNLDTNNLQKIRIAINSRFNEVQWFYPSLNGGGEVDSYVKLNTVIGPIGGWDYGSLGRTAWIDQSVLGPPIGANASDLDLYQHETSNDADGAPMDSWFQSGYFSIAEGDMMSFIDLVWPDMKWGQLGQAQTAQVQISFLVANYPGDTPTVYGPYTVTQATQYFNTRLRGRLVAVKIESNDLGSFWRIGAIRYRFAPDGKF